MPKKIRKIALINPKTPLQHENPRIFEMFQRNRERLKPWLAPPLNLLTIAALTPDHIEVRVIDEHFEQIDFSEEYDLVGLTAMTQQAFRAYDIARIFRNKNIPVVMGGIHASVIPEEALKHVDAVFVGEAEELWQVYLHELQEGKARKIYRSNGFVDLRKSPVPKYNLINYNAFKDIDNYFNYIPVQATRGCPHDCVFCAVSKLYGTKIRKKNVEQVIREIEQIQHHVRDSLILFADDNLFVDKKFGKELLRALIPLKIKYFAQTDISIAEDEELLRLAYKSGCHIAFIGLESLRESSLGEINRNKWKMKQVEKYARSIRKIQDNGIVAFGAFVIGFQHDDLSTFDEIRDFAVQNHIPGQFTLATPIPGSTLYQELQKQGRLYNDIFWNECNFYNLVYTHDHLTKKEAEDALIRLYDDVFNDENTLKRLFHMKNIYKTLPERWTYPTESIR
jgi:radical SAM superfamily enzyme YgiQ (UPF0313 family)